MIDKIFITIKIWFIKLFAPYTQNHASITRAKKSLATFEHITPTPAHGRATVGVIFTPIKMAAIIAPNKSRTIVAV